jgi:hypothetical protein
LFLAIGSAVIGAAPALAQGERKPTPKSSYRVEAGLVWEPLPCIRRRIKDVREQQIDALEISGKAVFGYLAPYSIQVRDQGLIRTFLKALQQAETSANGADGATHGGPNCLMDPSVMLRLKKSEPLAASQEGAVTYTDDANNDLTMAYDRLQFPFPSFLYGTKFYGPAFEKAVERLRRHRVLETRAVVARVEKDVVAYQHCNSALFIPNRSAQKKLDRQSALKRIRRVTDPER